MSPPPAPILCVCLNPVIQKTLLFDRLLPGEVNRTGEHRVDAAGKAVDVARVLGQTGRPALLLSQAGGANRDWFLSLCARDGLDLRAVESGSEIRFCHTLVERGEGRTTELVEEAEPVAAGTGGRLLGELDRLLPACRAVVVSGTKAAGLEEDLVPEIARRVRAAGLLLVLDVKGPDLLRALEHRPAAAKPNLSEFLATWPLPGRAGAGALHGAAPSGAGAAAEGEAAAPADGEAALRAHVEAVARELHGRFGASLVLTRGTEPTWWWDGRSLREEAVRPVEALNPTGSGDAFTAGFAAVLAEGGSLAAAVAEGTRLGALNAASLRPGSIL